MDTAICALTNWVEQQKSSSQRISLNKPIEKNQFSEDNDDDYQGAKLSMAMMSGNDSDEDDDDDFLPPMMGEDRAISLNTKVDESPVENEGIEEQLKKAAEFMSSTIIDDKFENDMVNINKATGLNEVQSLEKVNRLKDKLERSLVYPEPPKPSPDKADSGKTELTSALSSLLGDIKKRSKED